MCVCVCVCVCVYLCVCAKAEANVNQLHSKVVDILLNNIIDNTKYRRNADGSCVFCLPRKIRRNIYIFVGFKIAKFIKKV